MGKGMSIKAESPLYNKIGFPNAYIKKLTNQFTCFHLCRRLKLSIYEKFNFTEKFSTCITVILNLY